MRSRPLAWALFIVLAVELGAVLWLCHDFYPVGYYNDDAAFLGQARAFVATGRLYSSPWNPVDGLPLQPPGQALFLSPWVRFFPDSVGLLQAVDATVTLVTAGLLGWLVLPTLGSVGAALMAALFIANGPCASNGSTLMSDIPFSALTVACLLYAERRLKDVPSALLLGLALGCSMLLRIVGLATLGAVCLMLILQRRRSLSLVIFLAAGALYLPYYLVTLLSAQSAYVTAKVPLLAQAFAHGSYAQAWGSSFLRIIGGDFTQLGPWVLPMVLVLLAVSLVKVRQPLLPLFLLGNLAIVFLWPYQTARYYVVWWPICLFCAVRPWPRRWAWACLAFVFIASLPGLWRTMQVSARVPEITLARYDAEYWIRDHSASSATIVAPLAYQAWLFSGRRGYEQEASASVSDYTRQVATQDPTFCVVDYDNWTFKNVFGTPVAQMLPHLSDWLDCSTSYRRLYASPWQAVYRLVVPRGHVLVAWRDLREALDADQSGDDRLAQARLDAALAVWPDFPEARKFRATIVNPPDLNMLRQEVQQYPMDFDAARLLGQIDPRGSAPLLERSRRTAELLGEGPSEQALHALLHPPTP